MATLNNYTGTDEFSIFIAFHIIEDTTASVSINRLAKTMEEIFGDTQVRALLSNDHLSEEVIYRVQKPIIASDVAMAQFFEKLKQLFNITSNLSPHFTQVSDEADRGISL